MSVETLLHKCLNVDSVINISLFDVKNNMHFSGTATELNNSQKAMTVLTFFVSPRTITVTVEV